MWKIYSYGKLNIFFVENIYSLDNEVYLILGDGLVLVEVWDPGFI